MAAGVSPPADQIHPPAFPSGGRIPAEWRCNRGLDIFYCRSSDPPDCLRQLYESLHRAQHESFEGSGGTKGRRRRRDANRRPDDVRISPGIGHGNHPRHGLVPVPRPFLEPRVHGERHGRDRRRRVCDRADRHCALCRRAFRDLSCIVHCTSSSGQALLDVDSVVALPGECRARFGAISICRLYDPDHRRPGDQQATLISAKHQPWVREGPGRRRPAS